MVIDPNTEEQAEEADLLKKVHGTVIKREESSSLEYKFLSIRRR
jgi:hypothetical protein